MMPSILVVDDEQQIRQLIRERLEQAGYHVTEARDGQEAL
jgi:two-component system response regulator ResD